MASNLTFVNSAGNAIIKVDNSSDVAFNQKRNSVRITTSQLYGAGSVWTADILHAPFGCRFVFIFSKGACKLNNGMCLVFGQHGGAKPRVLQLAVKSTRSKTSTWLQLIKSPCTQRLYANSFNLVEASILTYKQGCTLDTKGSFTGTSISTNCSEANLGNQGCIIQDAASGAFGASFSKNQGGVFVTEYATNAINVWFFPVCFYLLFYLFCQNVYQRASIPSVLTDSSTKTLNTTTLGTPLANYDNTGCDITKFFLPQELIFDITLCGDL